MTMRYLVVEHYKDHHVLLYGDLVNGDYKEIFSGTENECYEYLRGITPETEEDSKDRDYLLDRYEISKYVPESVRKSLNNVSRSETTGRILISLKAGWRWGYEAYKYVAAYYPDLAVVETINEMCEIFNYIRRA